MQTLSKFRQVPTTCIEYVHPWTDSCWNATAGLLLVSAADSFRIYFVVYMLSLLMKGRIPRKKDIQHTVMGILQSTAFLTTSAFSYSMYLCMLHKMFGGFNFFTASYIPAFMSSLTAIIVERPSRRNMLCLYVSNVATETLWKMGVYRNMVAPIKYGQVMIFGLSTAFLTYYFRSGLHLEEKDSVFDIVRFVIGKEEEFVSPIEPVSSPSDNPVQSRPRNQRRKSSSYLIIQQILQLYQQTVKRLKQLPKNAACPHQHSCAHYVISGGTKLFSIGLIVQVMLKLILQMKKIVKAPGKLKKIFFTRDTLKIGGFLGGFTLLYRATVCSLRHLTNKDCPSYAIPATLLASTSFLSYPDNSAALYIMWKSLQITYNLLEQRDYVPKIPGFTLFLYCASTATLFHAATLEPLNLRPSYWKFLHGLSGGRIGVMDRSSFDVYGLDTSNQIQKALERTSTRPEILSYFGDF